VIYPEQIHFYVPENSSKITPMEKILIQFLPSILKKINISIKTFPHLFPLNELEIFQIEKILKNIIQEIQEKKKYFEKIVLLNIFQLLYLLKRSSNKQTEFYYENPILNKIINYINANIDKNIKIEDIAKSLSYSQSHISHIFKQFTGMPLKQYVLYKKVAEAQKILEKYKDVKVKLLSSKLGFSDFSLFNRIFKKITGLTPYNYKKYCTKYH
ncbi:MAG: AraC family transcriptional regulator, partial [Thermoplasmata archaeon]